MRCTAAIVSCLFALVFESRTIATEIDNFAFGLVCTDDSTFAWVCFETRDVHVTGQGRCVYDNNLYPCTWFGFEFDYSGAEPGDTIEGTSTSNRPINTGNPNETIAENTSTTEFQLTLDLIEGHFYNGQYSVLTVNAPPLEEEITCSLKGEQLLKFSYRVLYPPLDPERDVSLR